MESLDGQEEEKRGKMKEEKEQKGQKEEEKEDEISTRSKSEPEAQTKASSGKPPKHPATGNRSTENEFLSKGDGPLKKGAAISASPSPEPFLREEYTDRLLRAYEDIKRDSLRDNVTLRLVMDALQSHAGLLRTLEECSQWDGHQRHETYLDLMLSIQMEERSEDAPKGGHHLSFDAFKKLFPPPKTLSDANAFLHDAEELRQNTPTPELKELQGVGRGVQGTKRSSAAGSRRYPGGKPSSVTITKEALIDRLRKARATKCLRLDRCGLSEMPSDGEFTEYLREIHEISLKHNLLTSLPAEMAHLRRLRRLICSGNMLTRLPESVTRLPDLVSLDVSGNMLEYLPPSICYLRNLRSLIASHNRIRSLPPALGDMTFLSKVDLVGNPLHPILAEKVSAGMPMLLCFLQAIKHIIAEAQASGINPYGELDGEVALFGSEKLLSNAEFAMVGRVVDVRREMIKSRVDDASRSGILNLESMGSKEITDDMISPVAEGLRSLSIAHNAPLTALPAQLFRSQQLLRLNASSCSISMIPENSGLTHLSLLQTLDLSDNGLKELPGRAIVGLVSLRLLDISRNDLEEFPVELASLRSLRNIHFHSNPRLQDLSTYRKVYRKQGISGFMSLVVERAKGYVASHVARELEESITESRFQQASSTGMLDLSHLSLLDVPQRVYGGNGRGSPKQFTNRLGGWKAQEVAAGERLRTLSLSHNRLKRIPAELQSLYRLVRLDLSFNALSDDGVPSELSKLRSLVSINFSHNLLRHVPRAVTDMAQLEVLDVSHNKIEAISVRLLGLQKLNFLALTDNPLPEGTVSAAKRSILELRKLLQDTEGKLPRADLSDGTRAELSPRADVL